MYTDRGGILPLKKVSTSLKSTSEENIMAKHPLLAQLTDIANDEQDLEKIAGAEALALLDEIEKQAEAQGIDLSQCSDDEVVGLMQEWFSGAEKTAAAKIPTPDEAAGNDEVPEHMREKVAEYDYLGRVQAHAFVDELLKLQGEDGEEAEKVAGIEDLDEETFEKLAHYAAMDALSALEMTEEDKTREKVASLSMDDELTGYIYQRAGEMLDEKGWDVDKINEALNELVGQ